MTYAYQKQNRYRYLTRYLIIKLFRIQNNKYFEWLKFRLAYIIGNLINWGKKIKLKIFYT